MLTVKTGAKLIEHQLIGKSAYLVGRFGFGNFSEIIPQVYDSAIRYITKYLSKQDVKPYYSKGLYRFSRYAVLFELRHFGGVKQPRDICVKRFVELDSSNLRGKTLFLYCDMNVDR